MPYVLLCCLVILLLTACGGSPTATPYLRSTSAASAAPAASAAASTASGPAIGLFGGPSAPPQASAAPSASAAPGDGGDQGPTNNILVAEQARLLIKTGTLSLVVHDVDRIFGRLKVIARKHNGDIAHYTNTRTGDTRVADLIIAVESARFEDAMDEIRGLTDEIVERKVDKAEVQDVTEEFIDLQSQIRNLQLTEQQLRAVLAQATKTEDILAIQREIAAIRGQIEKHEGRALYLERRATMSTIALHLETRPPPPSPSPSPLPSPEPTPSPSLEPAISFTDTAGDAWSASLRVLGMVGAVVITVVVFFWWAFPLALVGWIAWRITRRARTAPASLAPPPAATPGD
jgi:hypothetical protein